MAARTPQSWRQLKDADNKPKMSFICLLQYWMMKHAPRRCGVLRDGRTGGFECNNNFLTLDVLHTCHIHYFLTKYRIIGITYLLKFSYYNVFSLTHE